TTLVVVAIPAAMVLRQAKRQDRSTGMSDRHRCREDGLSWNVAPTRSHVDAPGRLILAVDGEADRPGHAFLLALIIKNRIEWGFGRIDVGCGPDDFHRARALRCIRGRGLDAKLRQSCCAEDRAARSAEREVGIVQELEPE